MFEKESNVNKLGNVIICKADNSTNVILKCIVFNVQNSNNDYNYFFYKQLNLCLTYILNIENIKELRIPNNINTEIVNIFYNFLKLYEVKYRDINILKNINCNTKPIMKIVKYDKTVLIEKYTELI